MFNSTPMLLGLQAARKAPNCFLLILYQSACILYILRKALIVSVKNIPPAHWVFSSVLECIDICARRRVTICICFAPIGIFSLHLPLIGNASPHHPMLMLIPLLMLILILLKMTNMKLSLSPFFLNPIKQIACDFQCEILQKCYTAFSRWPA